MGDHLHFYLMLGLIPAGLLIVGSNVFKGPAEMRPIPEGYLPKEHEYFKHPIVRWLVKNVYAPYQQHYEVRLARVWEEGKKQNMYLLKREVQRQMRINQDYKGWYTREMNAEFIRISNASLDKTVEGRSFNTWK